MGVVEAHVSALIRKMLNAGDPLTHDHAVADALTFMARHVDAPAAEVAPPHCEHVFCPICKPPVHGLTCDCFSCHQRGADRKVEEAEKQLAIAKSHRTHCRRCQQAG